MKNLKIFLLLAVLLATAPGISSCSDKTAKARDEQGNPAAENKANARADQGMEFTLFTPATELFLESPALVTGEAASFAAHLTWLADFKPVSGGQLEVILAGGNGPEERFVADAPATPGIYKPVVTPRQSGRRELTLVLKMPQGEIRHELGPVTVFATMAEAANRDAAQQLRDDGITFTKEQQWKVDFATAQAIRGVARASVSGNGVLHGHPDAEAQLTAIIAGQINAAGRFPHVGMSVRRGQILAYLAPLLGGADDYAALEASEAKARIAHAQAKRERERMEKLFAQEAVPEKRLLAARSDEQMIAADLDAATRRLGQYGDSKGGIPIRAPIDGTLADVKAAPGGFVQEGALLFHIADTRRLWLEVSIPENEAARLGKPSGVWFSVDGDGRIYEFEVGKNARLIAVGGVVDAVTRTVPVIFEFSDNAQELRLGQSVRAWVRTAVANAEAVLIPASALQDESGTTTVYVQISGESFERRIVTPGAQDGAWVEIKAGIEANERVVTKGAYLVRLAATKTAASGHGHAH